MPKRSHKNKKYSVELKLKAVQDYLAGKGSQREICQKYGIVAKRTLEVWVLCYNGYREFKERRYAKGDIWLVNPKLYRNYLAECKALN